MYDLADWDMKSTPDGKEMQTVYTVELEHKLKELGIKLVSFGSPEPVTM